MEGSLSRFRVALVAGVVCLLLVPGFFPELTLAGADEAPTRTIELSTGWNLVSLPVNHSGWSAMDWSKSLEENTSLYVLSLCDWESGWVSYLRRDGTTLELISWHGSTDYLLDRNESYLIYTVENTGKPLDHSYEITLFTDYIGPLPQIELEKGWNNIAIPYTFGGRLDTQDILYTNNNIDTTATWDYNTESWLTTPGDGTYDIQKTQNGPTDYTMTHNANGLFIRSKTGFTWTGEKRWSEDTLLTDALDGNDSRYPAIAVWGDTLHVVWEYEWGTIPFIYRELRYKRSEDGGRTWTETINLTENDSRTSTQPDIAVWDDNVYVVWRDTRTLTPEVWINISYDGGKTWEGEQNITSDDSIESDMCKIAAQNDDVYTVWRDQRDHGLGDYEVYFRNSSDQGQSWGNAKRITNRNDIATDSNVVDNIAINGSTIHILFGGYVSAQNKWAVYYLKTDNKGQDWETPIKISFEDGTYHCVGAHIAVNGSNVHTVWRNGTPNQDIYYRMSNGDGDTGTWQEEIQITNDVNNSGSPRLCASSSEVHLIFIDDQQGADNAIFYSNSTNNLNWAIPSQISESDGGFDIQLVCQEKILYLVWDADDMGTDEIFFKRNCW